MAIKRFQQLPGLHAPQVDVIWLDTTSSYNFTSRFNCKTTELGWFWCCKSPKVSILHKIVGSYRAIKRSTQNCIAFLWNELQGCDFRCVIVESNEAETVFGSPKLDFTVITTCGNHSTIWGIGQTI
jgi:hypothetical protein